ncbi:hypothetical protein ASD86_18415 [Lysobacter sp. Root690]|nr:hypothetical protein ASD86_18415 [Lysobacter sp. Root690]
MTIFGDQLSIRIGAGSIVDLNDPIFWVDRADVAIRHGRHRYVLAIVEDEVFGYEVVVVTRNMRSAIVVSKQFLALTIDRSIDTPLFISSAGMVAFDVFVIVDVIDGVFRVDGLDHGVLWHLTAPCECFSATLVSVANNCSYAQTRMRL